MIICTVVHHAELLLSRELKGVKKHDVLEEGVTSGYIVRVGGVLRY